jgi:hypothetical protein
MQDQPSYVAGFSHIGENASWRGIGDVDRRKREQQFQNIRIFRNLTCRRMQITLNHRHPAPHRGALRNVTNAERGAVDADAPIDDSARMRTAKTCGPDASMVGVKSAVKTPPMTVTKKPDRRGEHDISRKTIAQGMPDCLR